MALVGATTWTMYLSRTMHSFGTVARSGGSTRITRAWNKDRAVQTIKPRLPFLYLEYLSFDPSEKTECLSDMCANRSPKANRIISLEPYVAIHSTRGVVASPVKHLSVMSRVFFNLWNWITCSGGISLSDPRSISLFLILRALLGDGALGEINLGWTFLRDLWWEVRVSTKGNFLVV